MNEKNITFSVLSAIGIILILLGHLDFDVLTFGGLFPYYSYHVMIFVFIAGYFQKDEDARNIMAFIKRKCQKLLIPYMIWNIIYGIICNFLKYFGFNLGDNITFYNLFLSPFMNGHQFGLNSPAWFVPALIVLETCDILIRALYDKIFALISLHISDKTADKITKLKETIFMLVYLSVGIIVVYLAKRGSVYDLYKFPGRIMLMAPSLQFGRLYKRNLEKYDNLPSVLYFPIIFVINLILTYMYVGLAYSTVWVTGFSGSFITPFITMFTGIALWLRVAKIITKLISKDTITHKLIVAIGDNTFGIMMNHLLVFLMIKSVFFFIIYFFHINSSFDVTAFENDIYYTFVPDGIVSFKWIYIMLGILIPTSCSIFRKNIALKLFPNNLKDH